MTRQRLNNGINSALLFTCLAFTLQACAGGYGTGSNGNAPASGVTNNAEAKKADATQTVFYVVTRDQPVYSINGQPNPAITLKRGVTYTFELKATGHPFWIKTQNSTGTANAYTDGVIGNGTERGTLTFNVPANAPATLHYNCQIHDMMNGVITIVD